MVMALSAQCSRDFVLRFPACCCRGTETARSFLHRFEIGVCSTEATELCSYQAMNEILAPGETPLMNCIVKRLNFSWCHSWQTKSSEHSHFAHYDCSECKSHTLVQALTPSCKGLLVGCLQTLRWAACTQDLRNCH
jgi:hypothetical protein